MRSLRWRRTPLLLGAVVALVIGLGAGSAFAYFGKPVHDSGAARAEMARSVTVVQATGTVATTLYPGATADLVVELDNPNNFPVDIVTVAGSGPVTSSGGVGNCVTTGVTVPTQTGLSITVAPGADVVVHIPDEVAMGSARVAAVRTPPSASPWRSRCSNDDRRARHRARWGFGLRILFFVAGFLLAGGTAADGLLRDQRGVQRQSLHPSPRPHSSRRPPRPTASANDTSGTMTIGWTAGSQPVGCAGPVPGGALQRTRQPRHGLHRRVRHHVVPGHRPGGRDDIRLFDHGRARQLAERLRHGVGDDGHPDPCSRPVVELDDGGRTRHRPEHRRHGRRHRRYDLYRVEDDRLVRPERRPIGSGPLLSIGFGDLRQWRGRTHRSGHVHELRGGEYRADGH